MKRSGGFSIESSSQTKKSMLNTTTQGAEQSAKKKEDSSYADNYEQTYFFTGNVERIIKWHRVFPQGRCYFEVIATAVSLQNGRYPGQKIILLRDNKGPILQVTHYMDQGPPGVSIVQGQKFKCLGYMTGENSLRSLCIRSATAEEVEALPRHCYIGDFAISRLINNNKDAK